MIKIKAVSSFKKIFLHDSFDMLEPIYSLKAARGERVSFQLAIKNVTSNRKKTHAKFSVCDEFKKYTQMYSVGHVQVNLASFEGVDDYFLSKAPGLYPDILYPITEDSAVVCDISNTVSVWFTVDVPKTIKPGIHTLTVSAVAKDTELTTKILLDIKKTVIPENDLIYTQWFHCDAIADYYNVPMMSNRHWRYIEAFLKTAATTGITMILTPLFTPPIDTKVGGERPTMQLVTVTKAGDRYTFDFSLLDKWVRLCHKYGIRYFEMSHLFTQWGAAYCPKVIINGKKCFGWEVASDSDEYRDFISQLMPPLTAHLKKLGIADKCYFHISDEPHMGDNKPDYQNYKKAKELIGPHLDGFKLMDALSQIEFYDSGLVDTPVPFIGHIDPFLQKDIKERWCYYCISFTHYISDRLMSMPSARTRVLGTQLYMYDMVGFLQWGYNFYYANHAMYKIDPYHTTDADNAWPGGNAFSVYPDKNGGPALESIRTKVFYEGLQDRMLLKALEKKIGKEETKALILKLADGNFKGFDKYPTHDSFLQNLHDTVLDILQ